MRWYCFKFREKKTENKKPKVGKTKNVRMIVKKRDLLKSKKLKDLFSGLGISTPLNKIPLVSCLLF